MTPYEYAIARHHTYHLFGRLYLEGISADLLSQLSAIPELADAAGDIDLDQAAADHYQITAVSVFPHESIFLDPSGLLGGSVCDLVSEVYEQNQFEVLSDIDHIGHELLFLSHLCVAEAQALSEGNGAEGASWYSRQQTFLTAHLLTWLAPLVAAIEQADSEFYGRLANLTLDLVADHLAQTADGPSAAFLPEFPPLATADSSLKEIARRLTTPPFCGIFLSRDAISALARRHNMPRGFGDRVQMLSNLLRTAGQYDSAAAVFADLSELFAAWNEIYQRQQEAFPHLSPWLRPWQDRTAHTMESLSEAAALVSTNQN